MSAAAKIRDMFAVPNESATAEINNTAVAYNTIGFISLFRSIREHWIWRDPVKFQWWIDILMECNHADKKVDFGYFLIDCKRGQTLHSLLEWSKRWRVDISTVRRFFKMLSDDNMIKLENLKKTTRLTVCKYDSYQQKQHDKQKQHADLEAEGEKNKLSSATNDKTRHSQSVDNELVTKNGDTQRNSDAIQTQFGDNTNNNGNNDSNNGNKRETPAQKFFKNEIANNHGHELVGKYSALVGYLLGENDEDIVFTNVMALEQQLSFKQYLKLREKWQSSSVDLRDILRSMENDKKAIKDKKSVYMTMNNWANIRSEKQPSKK